jgi:hypothetical protein
MSFLPSQMGDYWRPWRPRHGEVLLSVSGHYGTLPRDEYGRRYSVRTGTEYDMSQIKRIIQDARLRVNLVGLPLIPTNFDIAEQRLNKSLILPPGWPRMRSSTADHYLSTNSRQPRR